MKCPGCEREVYDAADGTPRLFCEVCLKSKAYQMLVDFQRHFIGRLAAGKDNLVLQKPGNAKRWHIKLVSFPRAWCGCDTTERWRDKSWQAWPRIDRTMYPLCEGCVQAFERMVAEERDAQPQATVL